jgi:hypothetical protein
MSIPPPRTRGAARPEDYIFGAKAPPEARVFYGPRQTTIRAVNTAQLKPTVLRMCWGALWRSTLWGLLAGTVIGSLYGVLVGLAYLGFGGGVGILTFGPGGATFGLVGGLVAGVADGVGIGLLTALKPPAASGDEARYLTRVRITAASCTLAAGCVWVGFAAPYSLSPPGILFFDVPIVIAMAVSYALAPRAVEWFAPGSAQRAGSPTT